MKKTDTFTTRSAAGVQHRTKATKPSLATSGTATVSLAAKDRAFMVKPTEAIAETLRKRLDGSLVVRRGGGAGEEGWSIDVVRPRSNPRAGFASNQAKGLVRGGGRDG